MKSARQPTRFFRQAKVLPAIDEEVSRARSPYLIIAAVDSKDVFLQSSCDYKKLNPERTAGEMRQTFARLAGIDPAPSKSSNPL